MPIYEYECLTCGVMFEKRQSFNDTPKADCPNGHPETRRLIAAPAIVFKGTGFYVNDSKGKNSANVTNAKSEKSEDASETKSENKETKSESKSESSAKAD